MQEVQEWEHTQWLTSTLIRGDEEERLNALNQYKDLYLINYENLPWLQTTLQKHWLDEGKLLPFDIVVFDEISKMKTSTSKRTKAFAKILPHFIYRIGLTGTPASNGYIGLHGQYLMIDGGERLGPNITSFRDRWFNHNPYSHRYVPQRGALASIRKKISDITLEVSENDHIDLPEVIERDYLLEMPQEIKKTYEEFEKEFFIEIEGQDVEAFNAAAKSAKCRQLANGAVYVKDLDPLGEAKGKPWVLFHEMKLQALDELIYSLQGMPLLLCYQFIHDKERLIERYKNVVFLDSKTDTASTIQKWNEGKIQLLAGHPASMAHGLNLQKGSHHIAWFGIPWDLELWLQAIGRLRRTGQKSKHVFCHKFIAKDTMEEALISPALKTKNATQETLRSEVKKYRDRKYGANYFSSASISASEADPLA